MPRRRYSRRRGGRRGHRKTGIIFGMGLLDMAQIAANANWLGVPGATRQALSGDFEGAGNTLATSWAGNMVPIIIGNLGFGVGRKLISRFAGPVRRWL